MPRVRPAVDGSASLYSLSAIAASAPAQFQDLAATDDGSVLYFSSPARQTGTDQFLHPKIFRWSRQGFELVAQREQTGVNTTANFHELISPDVSGDGRVLSAVGRRSCIGGSACVYFEYFAPEIARGANDPGFRIGRIQLSRNGRYALIFGSAGFGANPITRVDLMTGERFTREYSPLWVPSDRQDLTDDGAVLLAGNHRLALWLGDERAEIPLVDTPSAAVVSADGSAIVVETGGLPSQQAERTLWVIPAIGSEPVELAGPQISPFRPVISNDGRFAVFLEYGRVVLADLAAGVRRVLDEPAEPATEATISGDGNILYVATAANRLLRIDRSSGQAEELASRFVRVDTIFGAPVPGSRLIL